MGPNPNGGHPRDGSKPLLWGCRNNYTVVCQLLISHGAHVNVRDKEFHTPLYLAIGHNNEKLVRLLLERGARDHTGSNTGLSPVDGYNELDYISDSSSHDIDSSDNFSLSDRYSCDSDMDVCEDSSSYDIQALLTTHSTDRYTAPKPATRRHVWEVVIRNNRVPLVKLLLQFGYGANDRFLATFAKRRAQVKREVS